MPSNNLHTCTQKAAVKSAILIMKITNRSLKEWSMEESAYSLAEV
jgi:hypothetical protein